MLRKFVAAAALIAGFGVLGAPAVAIAAPTLVKASPAQDNAIDSAESYLDYTSFSRQGLIEQLQFEGFTLADATFAVEYIEAANGVDWNEQAVNSASSYLDYTSFSLSGLIEQLEFEGFTPSQAQYGASVAYAG